MLNYHEERQFLKDMSYIEAEKDIFYRQEWQEWQHQLHQKPAKIVVVKEEEYDRIEIDSPTL